MFRRIPALLGLAALATLTALAGPTAFGQEQQPEPAVKPDVRIAATISTKPFLTAAARMMKEDKGLVIAISPELISAQAIEALAEDQADLALLTRSLTLEDRSQYPSLDLTVLPVGMEVVALAVSNDLWDAGVQSITKAQMRGIYEQKITNWKDLGGPDQKITLFSFQQGAGVWEIFAEWLYGDNRKAPLPKVEIVATSQDARDDLEFTPGSIAPIAAGFADGSRCHALGIKFPDHVAELSPKQVAAGGYPLVRPIIALTIGRPTLRIRAVTEFFTGPAGQTLLKTNGALGLDAVPTPTPEP